MRSPMDEASYLQFYKNTTLGYSKSFQSRICKQLESQHRITFDPQRHIGDSDEILFFEKKNDFQAVIEKTSEDKKFAAFYENGEFDKLYRYSVPFFYEREDGKSVKDIIAGKKASLFEASSYVPDYILDEEIKDALPLYRIDGNVVMLKFVLQKMYYTPDTFDKMEYRYPVVVYIDDGFLEIRYDSMRYLSSVNVVSLGEYEKLVSDCIAWLQNELGLTLFFCDHTDIVKVVNDRTNTNVVIYKQMMELDSGGAAELTASDERDYVLPFVGEIRELIEENQELFGQSEEVKKLLLQYLEDKEATASYPYLYIKFKKPVVTQSYVVKVTFDYLKHVYTLLQHNSGDCKDLGMERMNDAIQYLCTSGSFVRGETI